jgi:hypothetical protein
VLCWRALQEGATVLTERNTGRFRFWHDERRFKGCIEKCLVQQSLFAAGEGCRQVYSYCIPDQSRVTLGAGHAVSMITHSLLGTAAAAEAAQQERLGSCAATKSSPRCQKPWPKPRPFIGPVQVVCALGGTPRQPQYLGPWASSGLLTGTCSGVQHAQHSRRCPYSRQGSWCRQYQDCTA